MNDYNPIPTSGPLAGVTVLDLTQFLAGPFATQILGDLGADIIKVEPPAGDSSRHVPPHRVGDDSVYYLSTNRNKRSIVMNLRDDADKEVLNALIAKADIVVENFRPGVLAKLGFTYEAAREANPGVVWCSISGFGQDGPYRDRPAYDMIVQALSGGMSITGERGGRPVRAGIPIGDLCAGMYATIGVLAALDKRRRTGEGDRIDISMLDAQVAMLSYQGAYYLHSGTVPGPQGSSHDSIPTYRCFTARDGVEVVVTANTERMWEGLCEALGRTDLLSDDRFGSPAARLQHRGALEPLLEQEFLARDADEWVELLIARGVPAGTVNSLDRVFADPQVTERGMVLEMSHPSCDRTIRVPGVPLKFGSGGRLENSYPPGLGEQSEHIRAWVSKAQA